MGEVIVTAIAGEAFAATFWGTVIAIVLDVAIAMAISYVATRLLAKTPAQGGLNADYAGLLANVEGSLNSRKIIYGTRRVGGQYFLRKTIGETLGPTFQQTIKLKFLHIGIALAGHEINAVNKIYFDDIEIELDVDGFVTTEQFVKDGKSYARVKIVYGTDDQEAQPDIVTEVPEWTINHRLRGVAYLYVRLEFNTDIFTQIPKITAEVEGKKVYDPRTSTTYFSNNAALCIRDYIVSNYGYNVPITDVDDVQIIAAANICDEDVTLIDGSTQKRYTCDTVLDRGVSLADNMQELVTTIAGSVIFTQGKFKINPGIYNIPTVYIDNTWLADSLSIVTRSTRKELFNAVKGIFIDETQKYQPTDFAPVTNATYEAQDGGERIYKDIELAATTNQERAQRIAKILLEKVRQGIVVNATFNFKALELTVWDNVYFTNEHLGWNNKVFKILDYKLDINGEAIKCTLQEESSESYDWDAGEATIIDPAPDTELPSAFDVDPPGSPQITEELYATLQGSGVKTKAIVSWAISPNAFVVGYQLEYKLTTDTDYIIAGQTDSTTLTIFDIEPGLYIFRVKAINRIGVSSVYVSNTYEIVGITAPPANITGLSLNGINNNAHLSWNQHPDLDVRIGGKILIKYTAETTSPSWSSAVEIVPAQPGYATQVVAPLLDGTYLVKAVDSEGNESINAATITSQIANIVKMNFVASSIQHPDFTGTKINMVVLDNKLQLDGVTLFDSATGLFDDAGGFFDGGTTGTFQTSGTYYFDNYIDVGKITTLRVTASIKSLIVDPTLTFDEAAGLFDARGGLFDGEDLTGINLKLFVRTTNDNPAGTPVWSAWRQFFVGDYTARAYEFKIEVESQDASLNIEISELSVRIDVPDIVDSGIAVTSASANITINFNKTFILPVSGPELAFAITNMQTGDYTDIASKDTDSFDISIRDSFGNRVARQFNWIAKGG